MLDNLIAQQSFCSDTCCSITRGALPHNDYHSCQANSYGGVARNASVLIESEEVKKPFFDSDLFSRIMQVIADRPSSDSPVTVSLFPCFANYASLALLLLPASC